MHRPCRFAPKTFHLHSLHACKDLRLSGVSCIFVENDDAMSDIEKIQLFESKKIRTAWDEEKQEWFFSIVDVCGVLTDQPDYDHAKNYWKVLKFRLIKEGNESVTKCNQLKLVSPKDGKRYSTDVADMALMFRIIESIPSKKAEPIKVWMAQVAAERINQAIDPERSIDQAIADYRRLGYSEAWINQRIKTWSGMTTREYKRYKGLTKENLRDNMTNMELLLNALAEETATEISKQRDPEGLAENAGIAKEGAEVAKSARKEVEKRLGRSVVSPEKAIDHIQSPEELPYSKPDEQ